MSSFSLIDYYSLGIKKDIFLSHTHAPDGCERDTHQRVQNLAIKLKELGIRSWFDVNNLQGDIPQGMRNGIDESTYFAVCVTNEYLERIQSPPVNGCAPDNGCAQEFNYAVEKKKKLIAIVMDSTKVDSWPQNLKEVCPLTDLYLNFRNDDKLASVAVKIRDIIGNDSLIHKEKERDNAIKKLETENANKTKAINDMTCDACEEPTTTKLTCYISNELCCPNCSQECSACENVISMSYIDMCGDEGDHRCHVCGEGEFFCENHLENQTCDCCSEKCNKFSLCEEHHLKECSNSDECENLVCTEHMETCVNCERNLCTDCADEKFPCSGKDCDVEYCVVCQQENLNYCEECGDQYCDDCIQNCSDCSCQYCEICIEDHSCEGVPVR